MFDATEVEIAIFAEADPTLGQEWEIFMNDIFLQFAPDSHWSTRTTDGRRLEGGGGAVRNAYRHIDPPPLLIYTTAQPISTEWVAGLDTRAMQGSKFR